MATCPVCKSASAEMSSAKRIPGRRDTSFFVRCGNCPIPFEISGSLWHLVVTNPAELERRRSRWAEFLRESRERGDAYAKLY